MVSLFPMKKFFLALLCAPFLLYSEVRETTRFADLLDVVDSDTLVLIDLDDTLTDSSLSLGSSAWRHWLKERSQGQKDPATQILLHDYYTYIAAKRVPVKPVEMDTPATVAALQEKGAIILCYTSRGRNQWYSTRIAGIDQLSKEQLASIGISFAASTHPQVFTSLPIYVDGILFGSLKSREKGDLLKEIFQNSNYSPKKVVFIDDKQEQVQSVDKAMGEMGIPCTAFWYRLIEKNQATFDPAVAAIQWKKLIEENVLLSDNDALQLKKS
ncbi:MAG: DUF2608 domain-containing protein [Candidatus Melainabacteria bacterium]|nr:DUF2608 domain-containing protein [Candidatus Melainabacteria bacterium]